MPNEKNNQNLIVSVAVVAGILGTLSAFMGSNRKIQGWKEQAKNIAGHVIEKRDIVNKNMLLGGVAGGLIGAATALLLAPKSGTDFIKDLAHPFLHQEEDVHSPPHPPSPSKAASRKKKEARVSHRKRVAKTKENTTHQSSAKKKLPVRRRTAMAATKAATAPKKAVSESAET